MTTVTFHSAAGRLDGVRAEGHSGYDEEGRDIVCAAVSAVVSLCECVVNDVLGLEAPVKVRKREASVSLRLPGGLSVQNERTCQDLLAGMAVYLQSLAGQYPKNLAVYLEDDDDEDE